MTFVSPTEILVLEKDEGTVRLVKDEKLIESPILKVNVSNRTERGMLGIDIMRDETSQPEFAFLYYTENVSSENQGKQSNRLYRYSVTTDYSSSFLSPIANLSSDIRLDDPKLLLDLPAEPVDIHNGGKVVTGPDNKIYLIIGDVNHKTKAQNYKPGPEPDGTGGILVIDNNGTHVENGIPGNNSQLAKYYAYGIRNGFGLDFDPLTGKLWDTENGWTKNDEVNLVEPGFNSGWIQVQGKAPSKFNLTNLESFGGRGIYSEPELSWYDSVAPTALEFLESDKLGKEYENDLFIASFNEGNIYHFDLYPDRSGLILPPPLADKVANNDKELRDAVFAQNLRKAC
jgi:glucose/arabinose dehydrogenase